MAKFRYYLVDTVNDTVTGTYDEEVAGNALEQEFLLVIDTEKGTVSSEDEDDMDIVAYSPEDCGEEDPADDEV